MDARKNFVQNRDVQRICVHGAASSRLTGDHKSMALRSGEDREWERLRAYGEERFRAKLRSEGLDPDTMTEDEKMEYVVNAVHEYRQEERAKDEPG